MVSFASFAPEDFPAGAEIHIPQNISLSDVSSTLAKKHVISSPFLFKMAVALLYGQRRIVAGDYLFLQPQNLWIVADRLVKGQQGLSPIRITIPEGSTVNDIAWILLKKIPHFNAPYFIRIAHDFEGYLFPDTYLFYPNKKPDEILETLRNTFDAELQSLYLDIKSGGRRKEDVVIMASLLEKEATSSDDRAIIAGILWKRLDEGMLLQVDPPLTYISGNTSGFVSLDDTKIDSLYNTYKYKGLPVGPIDNPGLEALKIAVHPLKTPYYYYLSDTKGNIHYATTYAGHLANKIKYFR